ncbi:Rhodocoxin reductase [compost metagenome]
MKESTVIVGSGQAGVSAAFKLRALGYLGSIVLVGAEPDLPYHRPPLSKKYLAGLADAQKLHIKHGKLYESESIDLLLDCHVAAIDRHRKAIEFADGRSITYDHLVLATGSRSRTLSPEQGGQASNIYTFRTLADAWRLRREMVQGRHLLVVGGGYIGLETAAVARGLGMDVTLIERDSRILGRVAASETAAYFRALHRQHGVRILEQASLACLDIRDRRVEAARLMDGTVIKADAVVVGVGVVPETSLAERAGLSVDNGIVVDSAGRTSDPSIYAAGDCASFPFDARRIRLESVQNAVDMAEIVALSIMGQTAYYRPIPWFWSDQYSTKLQIAGLNHGHTHVALRRVSNSVISVWYYDAQRLIAVDAINDAKAFMTAKRWLSVGHSPVAEEIIDPAIPLNAVPLHDNVALIN